MLAYFSLTTLCNANCGHCFLPENLRHKNPQQRSFSELTVDFQVLRNLGVDKVTLSGGEPTLRATLYDIVENALRYFKTVNIISNCSMPNELRQYIGKTDLWVSLDYYGERQDKWRGIPGLWSNYLSLAKNVDVRSTLLQDNTEDVENIIRAAMLLHRKVTVVPYRGNNTNLMPSPQSLGKLLRFIFQNKYEESIVIDDCATRQYLKMKNKSTEYVGCNACEGIIQVTATGQVTPCPFLPQEITDLFDPELKTKLAQTRKVLLQTFNGECQTCIHKTQCGGCKASLNNHCFLNQNRGD